MPTIDLHQVMAQHGLTHAQAREHLRHLLKQGNIYSRLSPYLLTGNELLPCVRADRPPTSAVELTPFPVSTSMLTSGLDIPALTEAKISWCYPSARVGDPVRRRVTAQLEQFYDLAAPRLGREWSWFDLDTARAPIRPLFNAILPVIDNYLLSDSLPSQPLAPEEKLVEAWQTKAADCYDTSALLLTKLNRDGNLLFSVALAVKDKVFSYRTYALEPTRYGFVRQQLFFILGPRLVPHRNQATTNTGKFRGRIYRRTRKTKTD